MRGHTRGTDPETSISRHIFRTNGPRDIILLLFSLAREPFKYSRAQTLHSVQYYRFKNYNLEKYPTEITLGGGGGGFFQYFIQPCAFICRSSESTVSGDAGVEPGNVGTSALPGRRSNHSARFHPHLARSHPHLTRPHPNLARSHRHSARS